MSVVARMKNADWQKPIVIVIVTIDPRNTEKATMAAKTGGIKGRRRILWAENRRSWIGEGTVKIERELKVNDVRRVTEMGM